MKATSGDKAKFTLYREDDENLQKIKEDIFKLNKIKKGRIYLLNAQHAFNRAVQLSGKDLSFDTINSNFYIS